MVHRLLELLFLRGNYQTCDWLALKAPSRNGYDAPTEPIPSAQQEKWRFSQAGDSYVASPVLTDTIPLAQ
jgi:hypothetical protein